MVQQPQQVVNHDDNDDQNQFDSIAPHPYGVLPGGNVYMEGTKSNNNNSTVRQSCIHQLLTDDLWQQILQYCSGYDLGSIVQTCREFYVAGHQPELWRDLVLRDIQQPQYKSQLLQVKETWKDTYVYRHYYLSVHNSNNEEQATMKNIKSHQPIPVAGVYSDTYFRTHLCRSFRIPSLWLKSPSLTTHTKRKGQVPRVAHSTLSLDDFLNTYERPNYPVVIAGAAKSWPAYQKWSNMEYMKQSTPHQLFRATSGAAPYHANFTMESFYQYCCQSTDLEEAPLYLFDRAALQAGHPLEQDCIPALHESCPYFNPLEHTTNGGHDLFQLLGEGKRPDHTWLIMGSQRSGSSFHMDPNATHAWNAAIVGRKRWIFYPPGVTPPGVHPSPSGDEVAMPISIGEWLLNYGPQHDAEKLRRGALECTVEPGDMIFVPHGWWHLVINLDQVNIAVTHNYVSQSNLSTVLRFLQKKQDQISGCRDRQESIKPEHLYQAFTTELQKVHPQWLQEAQDKANAGWTCKAWTDDVQEENRSTKRKKPKKKKSITKKRKRNGEGGGDTKTSSSSSNSIMARAKVSPTADGEEKKTEHEPSSVTESSSSSGGGGGFSFSFL